MKVVTKSPKDISDRSECPLPLDIIPNRMGINLCAVEAVTWTRQDDGQLVSIIIHFKPDNSEEVPPNGPALESCAEK